MYDKDDALEHKSRNMIYNFIQSHPGASFVTIMNFFNINKSTLMYHLNYLEKADQILSRLEGGNRCYYCKYEAGTGPDQFPGSSIINLTDKQKRILNIIKINPGISKDELMSRTRMNRKNLDYNLKRLHDLKILWMVKNNGVVGYEYITKEELREELFKRLVTKLISNEIDEETFVKIKKKLEELDLEELDDKL